MVAAVMLITAMATDTVFAQRGGRGGGGGGRSMGSSSRGGFGGGGSGRSGGSISQSPRSFQGGSSAAIARGGGDRSFQGRGGRPSYGGRPAFGGRSSYGGRAFYGNRGGYGRGYYRPGFGGYRRPYYSFYRPYLGFSIGILPFGYYPFYYGADQFYYADGLFYRQYDTQYKVVVPPVGAEVPSIPKDAQQVVINGQTYYEYKGVYYSETANADGKTVYIVAGKDGVLNTPDGTINADNIPQIGDIVTALPDGSRQVMLKGEKYYVSEDGVYYEEVIDANNNVTYKVVAN